MPESAYGPTNSCVGIANPLEVKGPGVAPACSGYPADDPWGAVEGLLSDAALRARMAGLGQRIRARDGVRRAADLIEKAAG
jgi:hypothetical protein